MADAAPVPTDSVWVVGDTLPEIVRGPVTRGDLALFAGASGDHVLLHIDSDYAKAAGFDDVFAHGMLSMAYLAQVLTGAFPPGAVREWSARFLAITPLHATVTCAGEIVEIRNETSGRVARIELRASADGTPTLQGTALVALDPTPTGTEALPA